MYIPTNFSVVNLHLPNPSVPVSELSSHAVSFTSNAALNPQGLSHRVLPQWQCSENLIKTASPSGGDMLLNGKAPLPGQIITLPLLAKTFRTLAKMGKEGFYKGRVAEAIVELIQNKGGVMDLEDLATHQSSFVTPIKYTYGGEVTVYEASRPFLECNSFFLTGGDNQSALQTAKVIYSVLFAVLCLQLLLPVRNHCTHCPGNS